MWGAFHRRIRQVPELKQRLFYLALKVLSRNQVWDIIVVFILLLAFLALLLLHGLIALGELAQGRE